MLAQGLEVSSASYFVQELRGQRRCQCIKLLFNGIKAEVHPIAVAKAAKTCPNGLSKSWQAFLRNLLCFIGKRLCTFVVDFGHQHDQGRDKSSDQIRVATACCICVACLWRANVSLRREPLHEHSHSSSIGKCGHKTCLSVVCLLAPDFLPRARAPATVGCSLESSPATQVEACSDNLF